MMAYGGNYHGPGIDGVYSNSSTHNYPHSGTTANEYTNFLDLMYNNQNISPLIAEKNARSNDVAEILEIEEKHD